MTIQEGWAIPSGVVSSEGRYVYRQRLQQCFSDHSRRLEDQLQGRAVKFIPLHELPWLVSAVAWVADIPCLMWARFA